MSGLTARNKEIVSKTLERLRLELSSLGEEDAVVKHHINSLLDDLEQQLPNLSDADYKAAVRDRLAELVRRFESQYPFITGLLEQIASLANMGV